MCCTLAFAEIVLQDLSELRTQGPRDIIRHVAAKLSHPCQMFAVHSIYSKVRHSELKSLSKDAALTHLASHGCYVAASIEHLPLRNADNTVRTKAELMSELHIVSAPSFVFSRQDKCMAHLHQAPLQQASSEIQAPNG